MIDPTPDPALPVALRGLVLAVLAWISARQVVGTPGDWGDRGRFARADGGDLDPAEVAAVFWAHHLGMVRTGPGWSRRRPLALTRQGQQALDIARTDPPSVLLSQISIAFP